MKKVILFIGVLFCMLITMPSYAQKTTKSQQEMTVTKKEIKKVTPQAQAQKFEKIPERVIHRPIDPITGEERPASPLPINENDISITFPTDGYSFKNSIRIQGETQKNNRVIVTVTDQDDQTNKKTMYADSDDDGEWEVRFTADVTSSIEHTYKITAHRIHSERGNTAIVTVTRRAPSRPLGAASSSGNGN